MSAAAVAPKVKKTTKAAAKPAAHPPYSQMVKTAIKALAERGGSSRIAIFKYILANYKVGDNVKGINAHLRQSLKANVTKGALKQVKGTGASGSFKLGEAKAVVKKPAATKAAKKPKAAKKTSPKKVVKPKKTASPKKKAAAKPKKAAVAKKSPKKVVKNPAAKKSPKKTVKKA